MKNCKNKTVASVFLKTFTFVFVGLSFVKASAEVMQKSGYSLDSQVLCDGLPQVDVKTSAGLCVGLLAGKQDGLKMPRYAVQSKDGIIYVTEMGGWAFDRGTVYAIYEVEDKDSGELHKKKTVVLNLFPNKKITTPGGIIMDPEGRLYVGTPTAVVRFYPRDKISGKFNLDPATEIVFDDFAKSIFRQDEYKSAKNYNLLYSQHKNKHPLLQLVANKDFNEIYVNIGAPSDDCSVGFKTLDENGKCIQAESPLASAAVWKVQLSPDSQRKTLKAVPFARGLRNSMALAVHPETGLVIQGENGIDLPSEDLPFEELNVLNEGAHYGWPYCHSNGLVAPLFVGKVTPADCAQKYTMPKIFMPAHSAPLGLIYYQSDLLPSLKNKLLVSWHGYQKNGHRIVAYPVNEKGEPTSNQFEEIVYGWEAQDGLRPRGAPTGLTVLNDGSILVLDDKNGAVLRISKGQPAQNNPSIGKPNSNKNHEISEANQKAFEPMIPFVQKNCVMCHSQFQKGSAVEILNEMKGTMLNLSSPWESSFWTKLNSRQMPPEMIRSTLHFEAREYDKILPQVENFIRALSKP
jgi:hypothetical protein